MDGLSRIGQAATSARKQLVWSVLMLLLAACLSIAAITSPFGQTADRPWYGYATNAEGNLEYWWSSFASREDCLFSMRTQLSPGMENAKWYSGPFGCFIVSNNYWTVWADTMMHGNGAVGCISRTISADAGTQRQIYQVRLVGTLREGPDWYCT